MLTLNVLPPKEKEDATYEIGRSVLIRFAVRLTFPMIVFSALLLPSYFLTTFQQSNVLSENSALKQDPRAVHAISVEGEIQHANKEIRTLKSYLNKSLPISTITESLVSSAKGGIIINSLQIDAVNKKVEIDGIAPLRQSLLDTISAYNLLPFVLSVDSPITNLVHETNNTFNLKILLK